MNYIVNEYGYSTGRVTGKNASNTFYTVDDIESFVSSFFYMIGFAVFFMPASYAVPASVMSLWKISVCVASIFIVFLYLKDCKITLHWLLLSFSAVFYYIISTIFMKSNGSMSSAVLGVARVVGLVTLLEHGFSRHKRQALKAFLIAGVLMCCVHYVTFILYRDQPSGMINAALASQYESTDRIKWFFFKHDNGSAFFFLPIMTGLWYYTCEYEHGLFASIAFTIASLYMYWSLWSVTAMVVLTLATVLIIMIYMDYSRNLHLFSLLNFKLIVLIGIAVSIIIINVGTGDIAVWLGKVFKKSSDLGGRANVWKQTLAAIKESLAFGWGYEDDLTTAARIGKNHCHSFILQLMYTGGLVTTLVHNIGYFFCDMPKRRRNRRLTRGQLCLLVSILSYFLLSALDWYLYISIPLFSFILYYYSYPEENNVEDDEVSFGY